MSAQVLLDLLNELGKRDKMRGLPSILSLFGNNLFEFNNTGSPEQQIRIWVNYFSLEDFFCK